MNHILDLSRRVWRTSSIRSCTKVSFSKFKDEKWYSDSRIMWDESLFVTVLRDNCWSKIYDKCLDVLREYHNFQLSLYFFFATISTYSTWPCCRPRRPSPWKTYPLRRQQRRRGKIGRAPVTIRGGGRSEGGTGRQIAAAAKWKLANLDRKKVVILSLETTSSLNK